MSTKKASLKRGSVIRVAAVMNQETRRQVFVRVTRDGRLGKRDAKHLGVKQVGSWFEVAATKWSAATKAARAGKAKRVGASRPTARLQKAA